MSEADYATDQAALVAELRSAGLPVGSVYDFLKAAVPYPAAYPILVRHLRIDHLPNIREGIIRALTVNDAGPEVTAALFTEFQGEQDPILKWVLANALKTSMPYKERQRHPEIAEVFKGGGAA